MPSRKSRSGSKYFQGDDLTKTSQDRKRGGASYEPWESKSSKGKKKRK